MRKGTASWQKKKQKTKKQKKKEEQKGKKMHEIDDFKKDFDLLFDLFKEKSKHMQSSQELFKKNNVISENK